MNTQFFSFKSLGLTALLLGFVAFASAQQKGVPASIESQFSQQHPNAQQIDWDVEDGEIEVEFEENGLQMELVYDASGSLLASEEGMKRTSLPAAIEAYLTANCDGMDFEEAVKVTRNGLTEYEVEMKKPGGEIELLFDANGNLSHRAEEFYDTSGQ